MPTCMPRLLDDGRVKQVIQHSERLPEGEPLAKPTVVENAEHVTCHQLLATHGAFVREGFQLLGLRLLVFFGVDCLGLVEQARNPLRNLTILVAFAAKLQEGHAVPAPVTLLIQGHHLGFGLHARPRAKQGDFGAAVATGPLLLRKEV